MTGRGQWPAGGIIQGFEDHGLPVDLRILVDLYDEHDQLMIVDIADDPVVAKPVTPILVEPRTLQAVRNLFWAFETCLFLFK